MRPQDHDAQGNVAVEDTATGEVSHRPAHLAQEILQRNPDGRFKVLERTTAGLAPKVAGDMARLHATSGGKDAKTVTGDATQLLTGDGHLAPPAQPAADAAPAAGEVAAEPKKAERQGKKDDAAVKANTEAHDPTK